MKSTYNPTADPLRAAKQQAAEHAVQEVQAGMRVGLGTGSTAYYAIVALGERVRAGLDIVGVPSSESSADLARQHGIPLAALTPAGLDVAIDGADEVDPNGQLIKGGGGALLREKLVAAATRRFIVIADESKQVPQLGTRFALPVEIVPWAWEVTAARIAAYQPKLRYTAAATPFVTDNGNFILDCVTGPIADPAALQHTLKQLVGVVETGLFINLARRVIFAGPAGISSLEF